MAGVIMKQLDKRAILERAKEKPKRVRANYNFDAVVYEPFISKCEKENVPATRVLEEFMRDFVK
jgi:hypothetical protein